MDNIEDIALTMIPNCGPKTIIHLIEQFGSAKNIFNTPKDQLVAQGELRPSLATHIASKAVFDKAEREIRFMKQHNITAITSGDSSYPQRLLECCDYPHVIYTKGDIDLNSRHYISVVGTRNITSYGERMCHNIITELSEMLPDVVVVSGLAFGTDIMAHKTALKAGLKNVSVMGRNLSSIYPAAHSNWAHNIVAQGGALVSEYNSTQDPDRSSFIQRNRIIAGMCDATIVIESAASGGSMSTATFASGYHREVFAVPGRVGDKYSEGTNALIAGRRANILRSAKDIVDNMLWGGGDTPQAVQGDIFAQYDAQVDEPTSMVLGAIGFDPVDGDVIAAKCDMSQSELSKILMNLQLDGRIRAVSANRFIRL